MRNSFLLCIQIFVVFLELQNDEVSKWTKEMYFTENTYKTAKKFKETGIG